MRFVQKFNNCSHSSMESSLSHHSAEPCISLPLSDSSRRHAQNPIRSHAIPLEVAQEAPLGLFTPFPLLPLELQRNIWHYAVLSPRIVEIHEEDVYIPTTERQRNQAMPPPLCSTAHHFGSKTAHPPLLQTCQESRKVALKTKYRNRDLGSISCMKPVYFEFEIDTAFLSQETLKIWESSWLRKRDRYNNTPRFPRWSAAAHGMRQNLRSLAFGAEMLTDQEITEEGSRMVPSVYSCRNIVGNLFQFEALEEVVLVLNNDGKMSCDKEISVIRLFQPDPDTEIAVLLQDLCNILYREYALHIKDLLLRQNQSSYRRRPRERENSPASSRSPPIIRCMVTKLRV